MIRARPSYWFLPTAAGIVSSVPRPMYVIYFQKRFFRLNISDYFGNIHDTLYEV